jgi:hypothetical protein
LGTSLPSNVCDERVRTPEGRGQRSPSPAGQPGRQLSGLVAGVVRTRFGSGAGGPGRPGPRGVGASGPAGPSGRDFATFVGFPTSPVDNRSLLAEGVTSGALAKRAGPVVFGLRGWVPALSVVAGARAGCTTGASLRSGCAPVAGSGRRGRRRATARRHLGRAGARRRRSAHGPTGAPSGRTRGSRSRIRPGENPCPPY